MKKYITAFIISIAFLSGCGNNNNNGFIEQHREANFEEKIMSWLSDLYAYQATANITYISNKNINEYVIQHVATASGKYFIEVIEPQHVAGSVTISDSQNIIQVHRGLNHRVELGNASENETKERTSLLLTNFAQFFLSSTDATITQEDGIATLTVGVDSGNAYIDSISLVITDDFVPISLTTLDVNNDQRIIVEYIDFVSNPELDVSIFEISQDNDN